MPIANVGMVLHAACGACVWGRGSACDCCGCDIRRVPGHDRRATFARLDAYARQLSAKDAPQLDMVCARSPPAEAGECGARW